MDCFLQLIALLEIDYCTYLSGSKLCLLCLRELCCTLGTLRMLFHVCTFFFCFQAVEKVRRHRGAAPACLKNMRFDGVFHE